MNCLLSRRILPRRSWVGNSVFTVLALLFPHDQCRANPPQGAPAPVAAKEPVPEVDLWSLYRMSGQSVGYIRESTWKTERGGTKTRVRMLVVINRLGNKVELQGDSTYEEDAEGKLQRARSESSASKQKTLVVAEIANGEVAVHTRAGDRDYERKLPFTGALIGSERARRLYVEKLREPGEQLEYQTFSPELRLVSKITSKVLARESIDIGGVKHATIKIEQTMEGYPAKRTLWLDVDGRVLKQTEPGPFGLTEVVRCTRAAALAAAGGGELPGEMYDQTLARANVRLPSPRSLSRVRLQLIQKDKSLGWPDFDGPRQKVISKQAGFLILEIRQGETAPPARRPAADTPELHDFLAADAIVQSDDPEVRRIAREVVGTETNTPTAARKLRDWVNQNMRFDLGIAVAPASEVVRNRGGTCIAYSVLLASLLRAEGIPARIVMGYVYVAGIWGGHAWVEYRAGESWVAIDAAVVGPARCDAARLICFRSSLRDGIGPHLGSLLQLYGNVEIRTQEYECDGKSTKVPDGAKPFEIDGDTYRNVWLGIELKKPATFRFGKMDQVYPDESVLELLGVHGEIVRLRQESVGRHSDSSEAAKAALGDQKLDGPVKKQRVAGRDALSSGVGRKACLTLVDRTDVWVLTVEADDASRLLDEIAAGFKLLP